MLISSHLPSLIKSGPAPSQQAPLKTDQRVKAEKGNTLPKDASDVVQPLMLSPTAMTFMQADASSRIARSDIFLQFDQASRAHANLDPKTILSLLE